MEQIQNLKDLRIAANLTQVDVAKNVGVEQAAVSHWEIGKSVPNRKNRKKLARHYKVPVEVIDQICRKDVSQDAGTPV